MPELLFPSTGDPKTTYKWNGRAFVVDGREVPVLAYDSSTSGWTDELTSFHEETAGDNHYIDIASRKHTTAALRRSIPTDGAIIIDIGCSSGSMLRTLRDQFPRATLMGADYISGPLPALAASLSGIPFLQFNLVSCPLFSNTIDAAILLGAKQRARWQTWLPWRIVGPLIDSHVGFTSHPIGWAEK